MRERSAICVKLMSFGKFFLIFFTTLRGIILKWFVLMAVLHSVIVVACVTIPVVRETVYSITGYSPSITLLPSADAGSIQHIVASTLQTSLMEFKTLEKKFTPLSERQALRP